MRRFILRTTVDVGSTAASATTCRVAVVRAPYNTNAGRIDNATISPTGNTNILQVYYDKVFTVGAPVGNPGFPINLSFSVPLRNTKIKFNGAGINNVSAESLFLIWSGSAPAGTTAPVWGSGIAETWFTP